MPTLYILDAIGDDGNGGGTTVQSVQSFLSNYTDAPRIKVMISSTGGDAWAGTAIHDQLMRFPGEVHTYGSGIVASAATIIFMAGSVRELSGNCQFMIHEAWAQAEGRASDFRRAGTSLDQLNRNMANIYVQRSGQPMQIIKQWMSEEKWLTAQDAKLFGFATIVSADVVAQANVDLSRFKNVPQSLQKQQAKNDLNYWRQKLGSRAVDAAFDMARANSRPKKLNAEQKAIIKAMEEQQKIRFDCPYCGQGIKTNSENEGKTVVCPKCGEKLTAMRGTSAKAQAPKSLASLIRLPSASKPFSAAKVLQAGGVRPAAPAKNAHPKSLADLIRFKS